MSTDKSKLRLADIFPENIFIIGAGGVGSRVLESFKYFISTALSKDLCSTFNLPTVWLIDHDHIEYKNIARQPFLLTEVGLNKVEALKRRYEDYIKIKAIPEAINAGTLAEIFTQEVLNKNFCVVSALDHPISSSQVYYYLLNNAVSKRKDGCWTYIYSGGEMRESVIKGEYRQVDKKVLSPYVTSFLYGEFWANPIVPVKPHQVNSLLKDPGNIFGRLSNGTGCGLGEQQSGIQSSEQNLNSVLHIEHIMNMLYFEGCVINQLVTDNGETKSFLPATLEEIFFPEDFPELVKFLETQTSSPSASADNQVTESWLKEQYSSFKDAKEAFGISAPGWTQLAERVNRITAALSTDAPEVVLDMTPQEEVLTVQEEVAIIEQDLPTAPVVVEEYEDYEDEAAFVEVEDEHPVPALTTNDDVPF